ncbi:MAG: MerR family transcriptional regulator [Actinobacteria bacterium]|nr:MerR family transcriptional regulator [Actinomycetota bacterium]
MEEREKGEEATAQPVEGTDDEPLYTIGVVSRMLNCEPSALRRYENAGLVRPGRTEGNTRLYSNNNVRTLRTVHKLMDEEKLNVRGVRMVLQLQEEIRELRSRVEELEECLRALREKEGEG